MNIVFSVLGDLLITLLISWSFIIILEFLGYILILIIKKLNGTKLEEAKIDINFFIRVLLGGIMWTGIVFLLGILRITFATNVFLLAVILLIPAIYRLSKLKLKPKLTPQLFGLIIAYCVLLYYGFKPIISYDANWYHIPIPKFFLQEGNIDYLNNMTVYSVHPYMNFFWNMFFLSIPFVSIPLKTISINLFLANLLILAARQVGITLYNLANISRTIQLVIPLFIACMPTTLIMLNWGYNDLYAFVYGVGLFLIIYKLYVLDTFSKFDLVLTLILCCGLFALKIYAAIFGVILSAIVILKYMNFELNRNKFISLFKISSIIFLILILPWIARSLYHTGRLLDPIGQPGLVEQTYNFIGAGNSINYMKEFAEMRFKKQLIPFLTYGITPLILIGLIAVLKSKDKVIKELCFVGFFGLFITCMLNFAGDFRYYLSTISFIIIPAILYLNYIHKNYRIVGGLIIGTLVVFTFLIPIREYRIDEERKRDDFMNKRNTVEQYMLVRQGNFNMDYYRSAKTPLPLNFLLKDPILVYNMVKTTYIENPIYDIYLKRKEMFFNPSLETMAQNLKILKVRYIMTRDKTPKDICIETGTKDKDSCNRDNIFLKDVYDKENNVQWWKVN